MLGTIIKCPNHKAIKEELLEKIEWETDSYMITHENDDGTLDENGPLTDWENYDDETDELGRFPWTPYMQQYMENAQDAILTTIETTYNTNEAEIDNYWFQQYTRNLTHGWHYHWSCLFHAIYYLELPKGTPPTMCRLPGGFEYTPNVKEGDILIMPSTICHCSPKNKSDKRKTIIAVNIDMIKEYDC